MGPEAFIKSRQAISLEHRHANEKSVYDDMADQVLAEWTDEEMLVDPDELPECHQFEGPMQTLIDWAGPLEGTTVLETGSGFGTLTCWLAMNGARVIATDISPKCLEVVDERARRNGVADRITTINTPVETLEGIEDESVDLVFGRTVAHHFELPLGCEHVSGAQAGRSGGVCRAGDVVAGLGLPAAPLTCGDQGVSPVRAYPG